jgi:DNA-binding transcriptional ArsR family regulator
MSISSEKVIIQAISHDIRREILRILNKEPMTFTELLNYVDISSGKLNYHLNQIKGFITKNEETTKYEVTLLGLKALDILETINQELTETDQPLLKEAYVAQKEIAYPLILEGINISIGAMFFFLFIHVILSVIILQEPNPPVFPIFVLFFILVGEIVILIWLLRVRKSTPAFLERFAKHLANTE